MNKHFIWDCIKSYVRSRLGLMVLLFIFAGIFAFIFFLYSLNTDAVTYASILCGLIGVIVLICDFARYCKHCRDVKIAASNIAVTTSYLPAAKDAVEGCYQDMIRTLFESRSLIMDENDAAKSYMSDYYAMWVHQIKVPISAMHMLLQDEPKSSPLNLKLFEIEQYVEMALSYVRINSDYTDYVLKEYPLDSIVKNAVRKYAPLFIAKKISLDIHDTDIRVNTDEKWLQFVIEQILSNSLKYTKKGTISISYESPKTLIIRDTGIGIAAEDIPRIGEKGFTGYNGRLYKKSTGIGLYLCNEILGRLSHTIEIRSEVDKGTSVFIGLDTRRIMIE